MAVWAEVLPAPRVDEGFAAGFATFCVLVYITIYAFESPVRYLLYLGSANTLILLRDGLLIGPLALIFFRDVLNGRVHPVMWLFAIVACVGFAVSYANFGVLAVSALGTKMLLGTLFGLVAGLPLMDTTKRVNRVFIALWMISVTGVVLEKFVVHFPWVGLHAIIGNVDVELARDWQITDQFENRVGGFTRVSISAAGLIPLLALVAVSHVRSFVIRNFVLLVTVGAVFLTTQKGALLATIVVWASLLVPRALRIPAQVVATLLCVVVDIMLPFVTGGMSIAPGSGGSYSASSLVQRIMITWPDSLAWIERHGIFPFGVGLGGIGESQRFVSSAAFHYPDNLFLFLLSSFGLLSIAFMAVIVWAALRAFARPPIVASCALSVLTFIVLYGSFVSIIEDQMEALFLGAAVGALFSTTQVVEKIRGPASGRNLLEQTTPA
jgi:hypothetical protein